MVEKNDRRPKKRDHLWRQACNQLLLVNHILIYLDTEILWLVRKRQNFQLHKKEVWIKKKNQTKNLSRIKKQIAVHKLFVKTENRRLSNWKNLVFKTIILLLKFLMIFSFQRISRWSLLSQRFTTLTKILKILSLKNNRTQVIRRKKSVDRFRSYQ